MFSVATLGQLGRAFELREFSDEEIGIAFDKADRNGNGILEPDEIAELTGVEYEEISSLVAAGKQSEIEISRDDFVKAVGVLAGKFDTRMLPVGMTMLCFGYTLGAFAAGGPDLINRVNMSQSEVGIMTMLFASGKVFGNIPFSVMCDTYGRKPVNLMGSLSLLAATINVLGIIAFETKPFMYGERICTGMAVAAAIAGASTMAADLSTPRNRIISMAPIAIGFELGNAFGAVAVGQALNNLSREITYGATAGLVALNAFYTVAALTETKPASVSSDRSIYEAHVHSVRNWMPFLRSPQMIEAALYQGAVWFGTGAGLMSCLPILVGKNHLNLEPADVGMVFGFLGIVNVTATAPLSKITDRVGKEPMMILGLALLGASYGGMSLSTDINTLYASIGAFGFSAAWMFSAPQGVAADCVNEQERANALAFVRTVGDLGMLFGGVAATALGQHYSPHAILQMISCTQLALPLISVIRRGLKASS